MKDIKCSFCGAPMKEEFDADLPIEQIDTSMIHKGAVNWFTCGYGSGFDTFQFLLAICDECLDKCKPLAHRCYIGTNDIVPGHLEFCGTPPVPEKKD